MASSTTLTKDIAKKFLQDPSGTDLDAYVAVDEAAAAALADYTGKYLSLNGLAKLAPSAANRLAEYAGYRIELNGLRALDEKTAIGLSKYSGALLELNGLPSISDATAKALAKFAGRLELDGITELTDTAAAALAKHEGPYLSLNGITSLSRKAADALSRYRGQCVSLRGLASSTSVAADEAAGDLPTVSSPQPQATPSIRGFIYAPDEETYETLMQDDGLGAMSFIEAGSPILPDELRGVGFQVHRPEDASQFIESLGETPYAYVCYADAEGVPVDVVIVQRVSLDELSIRLEDLRRFLTKNHIDFQDCEDSAASCVWGSREFQDNRLDI